MVVGLFQVGLARAIVLVVLVRGIARPVAVGGNDLDHQQPLRRTVLHQDGTYLPLHISRAAYLDLDVLREYQQRRPLPFRWRRSNRQLQHLARGLYATGCPRWQVEGAGGSVEHALTLPDVPPLVSPGGDVTQPGEDHQADLLFPCLLLQRLALLQPEDLEAHVVPARRLRGYLNYAPGLRCSPARYEQVGHVLASLPAVRGSGVQPASPLRSPLAQRVPCPWRRPRRWGRPTGTRSPGRSRGWSGCRSPPFYLRSSTSRARL